MQGFDSGTWTSAGPAVNVAVDAFKMMETIYTHDGSRLALELHCFPEHSQAEVFSLPFHFLSFYQSQALSTGFRSDHVASPGCAMLTCISVRQFLRPLPKTRFTFGSPGERLPTLSAQSEGHAQEDCDSAPQDRQGDRTGSAPMSRCPAWWHCLQVFLCEREVPMRVPMKCAEESERAFSFALTANLLHVNMATAFLFIYISITFFLSFLLSACLYHYTYRPILYVLYS